MGIDIIGWDTDELRVQLISMKLKRDQLENRRNFLSNINANVQNAWKGIAGAVFDERMDVDIANFDSIIKELDELISDLEKAGTKYGDAERSIRSEISSLERKIH